MIDIERDLIELFEARAASATAIDAFDEIVSGANRASLASRDDRQHRPWRPLIAALATAAAVIAIIVTVRASSEAPSPATPPPIEFPQEAPPAPLLQPAEAAAAEQGVGLVTLEDGELIVEGGPAWTGWAPASAATVTDFDVTSPSAVYAATCCEPIATIWREGQADVGGVRIDYVLDGVVKSTVDPRSGSATIGSQPLYEPGIADVAVVDRTTAVVLVHQPGPALIRLRTASFDEATPFERLSAPIEAAPSVCALAALGDSVLVLVGDTDEFQRCVSDRAIVVSVATLVPTAAIRFPDQLVIANTDHDRRLVGVTPDGSLVLGTIDVERPYESTWVTVRDSGDVVAAALAN